MTTSCADKKPAPPYKNILAIQSLLKGGMVAFMCEDLEAYSVAERQSPEAGQEFLDRRKERNRIEAENPPPIRPVPPPKPRLPPLALNDTMRFMQEAARNGISLASDKNKKLIAQGGRSTLEKWKLNIFNRRGSIKNTLLQIRSTHGDTDPLKLKELVEEANYHIDYIGMRALQEGRGDLEVITMYGADKKANTGRLTFPDDSLYLQDTAAQDNPNEIVEPRHYDLLSAAHLASMPLPPYRVKKVLPRDGLSAIFGPPGAAKTFLALDLALAISDGVEWFGSRVEPCDVLYICLEGQGGLPQRIQAYCEHHGEEAGKRLKFIIAPFSLLYQDDIGAFVKTVSDAGIFGGVIVIDTFSAATAGSDENSSADMGRALEAIKRILEMCGGLVILVHHSGKDASKGLRGHSSLSAALDIVIHVTRDGERRAWTLAKAKDGLDGGEHPFRLSIVELGVDEDGDRVSSCVVVPEGRPADSVRRIKVPTSGNQKVVYEVAGELLRLGKNWGKGGAPTTRPCIRVDELISACKGRLPVESHRVPERTRAAITGLVTKGCLILREDWLWVP